MKDNFKIIAIKTGQRAPEILTKKGLRLEYLKILQSNTIYPFYTNFKFLNNDFKLIESESNKFISLYSFNDKTVNINAIVGGNGSGKSTLIDLLSWASYNLGAKLGILKDENDKSLSPFKFLEIDILYHIDKKTYKCISFHNGKITLADYLVKGHIIEQLDIKNEINSIDSLKDFFYSIVINYSLYSLNSLEIGDWIKPLFHKNDGYQTPLVLNPMRTDGQIDINKEKRLLTRRLIANLLEDIGGKDEKDSLRNLANGKIAKRLLLTYIPAPKWEEPKGNIITAILPHLKNIFKVKISQEQLDKDRFINVTLNYIVEKLIKITTTYSPYQKYKQGNSIKWLNAFLQKIYKSDSHIFFKVKGAILYLKNFEKIFNKKECSLDNKILLSIEDLSTLTQTIDKTEEFWVNTFMMVPPSFFNVEIIPEDNSPFDFLSSGEKQRIHSISSIVYHLINLNSVEQIKEEKKDNNYIRFKYVNIILDEIELYYHPEWQRTYISDLLFYLEKINPNNLNKIQGINITFLTHSPYILSDIPVSNILRLDKGKIQTSNTQTFGANIHDLLANDFFMKKGSIGEFAMQKIQYVIDTLNHTEKNINKEEILNLINIIGEPFLKTKLLEMYYTKFDREKRIQELKKELNKLEQLD